MFKSEKQFTQRASKIAFEETFMRVDTPDTSFDSSVGYRFSYPQHWLSNPSEQKMIGLRSLRVTPTHHVIMLNLEIFKFIIDDYVRIESEVTGEHVPLNIIVTASTDLETVCKYISDQISYAFPTKTVSGILPRFNYGYNPSTGRLDFIIQNTELNDDRLLFEFSDPSHTTDPDTGDDVDTNFEEFAKFLNQNDYEPFKAIIEDRTIPKTFYHVWDRETLFFHTTFSTSHRGLIGRNLDFWPTPSKKYFFRDNTNDFYVTFSTDGVHKIFPYYCNFYLELTFILNYDRSLT